MKRRPVRYTLLLARSGGGSRALTFPGWAVGLFLAFLALWTGVNLYLWHRAREVRALEARLHALSQEARRLSLALEAEKTWRRLTGHKQIALVMLGRRFVDGELQDAA